MDDVLDRLARLAELRQREQGWIDDGLAYRVAAHLKVRRRKLLCVQCGGRFLASRADARYCSTRCRVKAHRAPGYRVGSAAALTVPRDRDELAGCPQHRFGLKG